MWEDFPGKRELDVSKKLFLGALVKTAIFFAAIRLLLWLIGSPLLTAIFYFIAGGFFVSYFGGALNFLVIYANKGLMPVLCTSEQWRARVETSSLHCVMTEESRLKFLCDRFESRKGIGSIGDILIDWGLGTALVGIVIFLIAACALILFLVAQWMLA